MPTSSETIRNVYEAFARGDIPVVLAALDPSVKWTEAEGFPYGGTYTGPEAVLQNVFMKLGTEWEGFSAVPHEFIVDGETIVALGTYSGKFKATGKRMSAPFAHVWKLQHGKVRTFWQHTDTVLVQGALR
jgi:uncharacterized protein